MHQVDATFIGDDAWLHQCAAHFAKAVQAADTSAHFTSQRQEAVDAVASPLPLTEALRTWCRSFSLVASIEIPQLGNSRSIYSLNDLME